MAESLWRMMDANLNRCNEGLRVIEDWCRFVADRGDLSGQAKECRHRLQTISTAWPAAELLTARDSLGDVGRVIETDSEYQRQDDLALLQANFSRVQQSLRVLEETAKRLQSPSRELEALRYTVYDLHREVVLLAIGFEKDSAGQLNGIADSKEIPAAGTRRRKLLAKARLYVLTDLCGGLEFLTQHIQRLIQGGADVIQLRDKQADDRTLLLAAITVAQLCRDADVLFIVNDRPDLAVAAGADGVHVGQEELPVEVVRRLVGPELLIGLSTHDVQQVTIASEDLACDYLGVGPVFSSQTKSFSSHVGAELLRAIAAMQSNGLSMDSLFHDSNNSAKTLPNRSGRGNESLHTDDSGFAIRSPKPIFAIGGINLTNITQVTATGFHRVAVQNAAGQGDEVVQRTASLKEQLSNYSH